MAICVLSFMVWLHHFFTMGAGADVNAFFGIMTHDHRRADRREGLQLAVHALWRPRPLHARRCCGRSASSCTFVIGGMTGVLLAIPPADFVLHNSLFLVAHFHNVIIGGVLFGAFAGYIYWFPKAFGFTPPRGARQGRLLVLAGRLLPRLHAALCARPDGRDAAHAALSPRPAGSR